MANIASVVISNCTRDFDKEYHYAIPTELAGRVEPGVRVIVPFGGGNRSVEAYVLSLEDDTKMNGLKEIKEVLDQSPVLDGNMIKLAGWMKDRYICTSADAIKCMLPPGIGVKSLRIIKLLKSLEVVALKGGRATVPTRILEELESLGGECEYEEFKVRLNIKSFSKYIKELENSGHIRIFEEFSSKVKEKFIRVAYLAIPREEVVDEIESNRIRKIQHIRILEMLLDNQYISTADLVRFASVSPGVIETLRKKGYIDYKDVEVKRDPYRNACIQPTSPLQPTPQQLEVLEHTKRLLDRGEFGEVLIHGVTGSGKTEVYLQLIRHVIDSGREAVVLVPEISLTPQMVERFKGRFGDSVAVLHSRLSLGERYDQWRLIREGRIKVAVGARSAVFAPFRRLGLVIIDEEHEGSYKSETTPKYNAREVARERCSLEKGVILYGSATPSVDTYFKAAGGKIELLEMKERANNMLMPQVELVDMRNELDEGNRSVFSRRLAREIVKNAEMGQQTILFLNRRGYSSFVLCRKCGYTLKCVNCNISMTYHAHEDRLICHYCGYTTRNVELCPKCKSNYIRQFGTGTQKVEEEVRKQFPGCSVIRMDMDTTSYKNSHEEILRKFREENINIMVGTQMIAKGHDFPNVTLVGVLAADSLLNVGDYNSSERAFQLITQVAGRAGRGELPGRVVIQSYNTDDFSILSACKHDFDSFYSQEIKLREKLVYPPYTNISVIVLSGINDRMVFNSAKTLKTSILGRFAGIEIEAEVFGPTRSPLTKIKNKYRWRIIIKCKHLDPLVNVLSQVSDEFRKKKENKAIEISLDINPVNML